MKDNFLKLVSSELKIIRIEHNDLQEELANKSGVATSTISNYENGDKNMKINKIEQILNPYNISLSIFFERVLAKTQKTKRMDRIFGNNDS